MIRVKFVAIFNNLMEKRLHKIHCYCRFWYPQAGYDDRLKFEYAPPFSNPKYRKYFACQIIGFNLKPIRSKIYLHNACKYAYAPNVKFADS